MNSKPLLSRGYRWQSVTAGGLGFLVAMAIGYPAAAQDARTLRFVEITEPTVLSLHEDLGNVPTHPLQAIYEPLLRVDQTMQLQPGLASSWEQLDDTTYRLELREGVRFHSGNPLTAQAVKDYIEWQLGPEGGGTYFKPISEMTVQGERTLDIKLSRPHGPILHQLTMPHTAIGDIRQFEEMGAEHMRTNPSGTGAYMLETWDLGSQVVLKANPDYWQGEPGLDRIQFRFIPDGAARTIALESGQIDVVVTVPGPDIARLEAHDDITVIDQYEMRSIVWPLNFHDPILSDINVRRALAHAIDYRLVMETILGAGGRVMDGVLPAGTFGAAEFTYDPDPEMAASLLAEAGWAKNARGFYEKDGQVLELNHYAGAHVPQEIEVAEGIQTLLREFGIDLKIQVLERAAHVQNLYSTAKVGGPKPEYSTTQWDHGIRTGEAAVMLDPLFTCEGPRNFAHYCNPEYDALIVKAVSGAPEEERLEAYRQAQALLHRDVVVLPMWQPRLSMSYRSNVKDLSLLPTGVLENWSELSIE